MNDVRAEAPQESPPIRVFLLDDHEIVRRGMSHVPEGRQIFPHHTVRENLLLAKKDATEDDLRDALGGIVYSGTSDIQRVIIASQLGLES